MAPRSDSREHPRARARLKVDYHFASTTGSGFTRDISEGGLFIKTRDFAQRGVRIYMRLHLPGSAAGGDPLKIIGIVARRTPGRPEQPAGIGVHFEVAYAKTKGQLHDFVQNLLQFADHDDIEPVDDDDDGELGYRLRFAPPSQPINPLGHMSTDEIKKVFEFGGQDQRAPRLVTNINSIARLAFGAVVFASTLYLLAWMLGLLGD
jgi:type IV pilus assembly protein PilZ